MSRKVRIADLGELAEKELARIGSACNALIIKIQRILNHLEKHPEIIPQLEAILGTATAMASAFEAHLAAGELGDQVIIEALNQLDAELRPGGAGEDGEGEEAPREFSCHTDIISLPEAISMISYAKKTGTLKAALDEETLVVDFHEGDVIGAYSDSPPRGTRLGDILIAKGLIDRQTLNRFLDKHLKAPKRIIGLAMIEEGLLTHEELKMALEHQIQELFYRMFRVQAAEYCFTTGSQEGRSHQGVRLNVTQLLLEGARNADWSEHCTAVRDWEPGKV